MERFEKARRAAVVDVLGDVAVETRHARGEGERVEIEVDAGTAPVGRNDVDRLHRIAELAQECKERVAGVAGTETGRSDHATVLRSGVSEVGGWMARLDCACAAPLPRTLAALGVTATACRSAGPT